MDRTQLAEALRGVLRPPWADRERLATLNDQVEAACKLADDYAAWRIEQAARTDLALWDGGPRPAALVAVLPAGRRP